MKTLLACWEFLERTWCRLAHDRIMWPVRGFYECGICGRRFPVVWEAAPQRGLACPVPAPQTRRALREVERHAHAAA